MSEKKLLKKDDYKPERTSLRNRQGFFIADNVLQKDADDIIKRYNAYDQLQDEKASKDEQIKKLEAENEAKQLTIDIFKTERDLYKNKCDRNLKTRKPDNYYKGISKSTIEVFVQTVKSALCEFPNEPLDDIETMLSEACIKLQQLQVCSNISSVIINRWYILANKYAPIDEVKKQELGIDEAVNFVKESEKQIKQLQAHLKTAKEENAIMYDEANAENVTLIGKIEKLLADNKQLKQDLGDSEDNAHELQICYDEMLPICLKDKQASCPDSECNARSCNEKCMVSDDSNEEKEQGDVQ